MFGNLIRTVLSLRNLVCMMGVVDVLNIIKQVSLFVQTVNALQWEKIQAHRRARNRILTVRLLLCSSLALALL